MNNKYELIEVKILEAIRDGAKEHLHQHGKVWSAAAEVTGREDNPYVWCVVKTRLQSLRERGYLVHHRRVGWSLTEAGQIHLDKLDGKIERTVHVLRCGGDDWTPTAEELQKLVSLFRDGGKDPMGAVLAVDARVEHATLHVNKGDEFVAIDAYMTDTEITECAHAWMVAPGDVNVQAFRDKLKQMRGQ